MLRRLSANPLLLSSTSIGGGEHCWKTYIIYHMVEYRNWEEIVFISRYIYIYCDDMLGVREIKVCWRGCLPTHLARKEDGLIWLSQGTIHLISRL